MTEIKDYDIAQSHDEWLELRTKGLGGSDIGSVLGLNAYKSPYEVWLEKTGQIKPPDISDKIAIQIGNELEDLVARLFTQETGKRVQKSNKTYYHKEHQFLLANIDRKIVGEKALLECKTTSVFNRDQWLGDEVPASYLMQVQHYLNVLDYERAYIAVIIGNQEFIWKEITRDNELIEIYQSQAVEFWQKNVLGGEPPEIDGSNVTKQALDTKYHNLSDEAIAMDLAQIETVKYIQSLKDDEKAINKMKSLEENKLKEFMGLNDVQSLYSDDYTVTWKPSTRTSVDSRRLKKELPDIYDEYSNTTTYNRLTIKENRGE